MTNKMPAAIRGGHLFLRKNHIFPKTPLTMGRFSRMIEKGVTNHYMEGIPLERFFKLKEHGTTVKTEIIAGLTTFFAMAYIIFVNPSYLSQAGMDYTSRARGDLRFRCDRLLPDRFPRECSVRAGAGHGSERLLHLHASAPAWATPGSRRWRSFSSPAFCS